MPARHGLGGAALDCFVYPARTIVLREWPVQTAASGDLAYESNTFTITDKAGKKIDSGKYVTVFARKDGKWVIVRDIWNSDAGPATP